MREFTFAIEYKRGADPIMDVFIEHSEAVAYSLDGYVTADRFWRIERISGPSNALNRIKRLRFDDTVCGESITEFDCIATRYHDILDRSDDTLVMYTYLENIDECESIHTLAGKHLDPGLVFETRRQEHRHEWRILMRSDARVGLLYDEIGARIRDDLSFQIGHLQDADGWQQDVFASIAIPPEQRTALRAAVDAGYYRTPREITLDDLADRLDIPRSTLSYRLRQAEARLVRRFVDESLQDGAW